MRYFIDYGCAAVQLNAVYGKEHHQFDIRYITSLEVFARRMESDICCTIHLRYEVGERVGGIEVGGKGG